MIGPRDVADHLLPAVIHLMVVAALCLAAAPASQPSVQPDPPAAATSQPTMPMADLVNDEFHVHIQYPADWHVVKPPVNHQFISLQTVPADRSDPAFCVIGLRVQTGPDGVSDPELLKDISGEMVNYTFHNGGKKVAIKPAMLGELTARLICFDLQKPAGDSRVMCVIAVRHRVEYVFTVAGPARALDRIRPGVDQMLKSFSLTD